MWRFVFGTAALAVLASSPAAAERPWRPGGYTGDRRCAATLHWASLEPSHTVAERASVRAVMLVACSPAGAAPPPPRLPNASPPPTRFIRVRWRAQGSVGARGTGQTKKNNAEVAGVAAAWIETNLR